jgi:exodeoxyribonuclease VII large subunit
VAGRLKPAAQRRLDRLGERLGALGKLYASVDPDRPLQRGFARVHRADGALVREGASLRPGEAISLKFGDQVTRQAVVDADAVAAAKPARPKKTRPPAQGDLF